MASASLLVFCTEDELVSWLRALCEAKELGCAIFRDSIDSAILVEAPEQIEPYEDIYRMFLYPRTARPDSPLSMNDVEARQWGWVDVRPGHLHKVNSSRVLTLSEVHGEDSDLETIHPSRFVRWIKRHARDVLTAGVRARNEAADGGGSVYRNIQHTEAGLRLYRSGVIWKQFPDGRVIFEPL